MKHARKDYSESIVDLSKKIPHDEPVFLLRGQDAFAPVALEHYATLVEAGGGCKTIVRNTRRHAQSMRDWQKNMQAKHSPDMPENTSEYPE